MKDIEKIKGKTVYICGPITGLPELNYSEFVEAAKAVHFLGGVPVIPHDLHEGGDLPKFANDNEEHQFWMRLCVATLMDCDTVLRLENWHESRGAKMEVEIVNIMNTHYPTIEIIDAIKVLPLIKEMAM